VLLRLLKSGWMDWSLQTSVFLLLFFLIWAGSIFMLLLAVWWA